MPRPSVEAERREQILKATCEVISQRGMHEMRLSDAAKRAGVSSGTVHYYFDSKRALMVAAFDYNFSLSLTRRRALLDSEQPALPLLEQLIDSYLPNGKTTIVAWRVWAELWAEAMRDKDFQAVNERLYGDWRQLVAEIITRGQEAGSMRAGDPLELANMLVGLIDGLAIQVLTRSSNMTLEEMQKTVRGFIASTIAA